MQEGQKETELASKKSEPEPKLSEFDPTIDYFIGYVLDGKYQIESLLGSGGWGTVYKGRHLSLQADIAIKIIHKHLSKDPSGLRRLSQEAAHLNKLSSPYIVKLMDYGTNPTPYLVMEYFDGITLSNHLEKNGALKFKDALRLFRQVTEGLIAAHKLGLVHRDLKPGNIMLRVQPGTIDSKILDFGIAKISGTQTDSTALTATGEVLGSPPYLPPEQWSGVCDHRSDVYALGCIMYEAITNKPAFSARFGPEYMNLHISTMPLPLKKLDKTLDLPVDLEHMIFRCLQKNPDDRYQNAELLLADIQNIELGNAIVTLDPAKLHKSASKVPIIAAGFIALGVLALTITWMLNSRTETRINPSASISSISVDEKWHSLDTDGQTQFNTGRLQEARQSFQNALSLAEQAKKTELISASLNELLDIFRASKLNTEAHETKKRLDQLEASDTTATLVEQLHKSLTEAKQKEGSNSPEFQFHVRTLCQKGAKEVTARLDENQEEGIEELISTMKTLLDQVFNADDPVYASYYQSLGEWSAYTGAHRTSIANFDKALALQENQTDNESLVLSAKAKSEAFEAVTASQKSSTISDARRAVELAQKHFGLERAETARSIINAARVFDILGENEKAAQSVRALISSMETQSANAPKRELADAYIVLAQTADAPEYLKKALSALESETEKNYTMLCFCLIEIARKLTSLSTAQAEHYLDRAEAIKQRFVPPNSDLMNATLQDARSQTYSRLKNYQAAIASRKESLAAKQILFGFQSPEIVKDLVELAQLQDKNQQASEAEKTYTQAIALMKNIDANTKPNYPICRRVDKQRARTALTTSYCSWLDKQGKTREAQIFKDKMTNQEIR